MIAWATLAAERELGLVEGSLDLKVLGRLLAQP